MKDKLVKTGRKKGYYRLKGMLSISLFALATLAVSAVPVGIGLKIAEATAEESSHTIDSSEPSVEEPLESVED